MLLHDSFRDVLLYTLDTFTCAELYKLLSICTQFRTLTINLFKSKSTVQYLYALTPNHIISQLTKNHIKLESPGEPKLDPSPRTKLQLDIFSDYYLHVNTE